MTPKLATGVSAFPCASGFKTTDLAGLTKLAESVIVTEQLQAMISATVNTTDADYAIVSTVQGACVFSRVHLVSGCVDRRVCFCDSRGIILTL